MPQMSTVAQQDVAPLRKKRVTKLYIFIKILVTYDKYEIQHIPRANKFKTIQICIQILIYITYYEVLLKVFGLYIYNFS